MVVIGSLVGFLFACLGIALGRMGAHHLYALPTQAAPHAGLDALLPWIADLQHPGIALLAVFWMLATFFGSYVADLVARSVVAGWLVTFAVCALAIGLGMVGRVPLLFAASGVVLALLAGLHARMKACTTQLGRTRRHAHRVQLQPGREERMRPAVPPQFVRAAAAPRPTRSVRPLPGTPQWQQFLSASACAEASFR